MTKKMSLAEAFLTLQEENKKLNKLFEERNDSKINIYKLIKTDTEDKRELEHEPHEKTMNEIFDEINNTMRNIRKLRISIALGNISSYDKKDILVDFKDRETSEKICLQEAIILIKQLRDELPIINSLSVLKTTKRIINPLNSYEDTSLCYERVIEPTFNTKNMKALYRKYSSLIKKLELEINQCNYNNQVEVDYIDSTEDL